MPPPCCLQPRHHPMVQCRLPVKFLFKGNRFPTNKTTVMSSLCSTHCSGVEKQQKQVNDSVLSQAEGKVAQGQRQPLRLHSAAEATLPANHLLLQKAESLWVLPSAQWGRGLGTHRLPGEGEHRAGFSQAFKEELQSTHFVPGHCLGAGDPRSRPSPCPPGAQEPTRYSGAVLGAGKSGLGDSYQGERTGHTRVLAKAAAASQASSLTLTRQVTGMASLSFQVLSSCVS